MSWPLCVFCCVAWIFTCLTVLVIYFAESEERKEKR